MLSTKLPKQSNEERKVFLRNGTETTGYPYREKKKTNLDSLSYTTYKTLLRFRDLTLKARTIWLVEENIREYVHNLQLSRDFTDRTQKIITRKKLINNRLYQNCK